MAEVTHPPSGDFLALVARCSRIRAANGDESAAFAQAEREIASGGFDALIPRQRLDAWVAWIGQYAPDAAADLPKRLAINVTVANLDRWGITLAFVAWVIAHQADHLLGSSAAPDDVHLRRRAWATLVGYLNDARSATAAALQRALRRALELSGEPDSDLLAEIIQSRTLLDAGRYAEALALAEGVHVRLGEHAAENIRELAQVQLARVLVAVDRHADALPHFDAALGAGTPSLSATGRAALQLSRAACLAELGDAAESTSGYESALASLRGTGGVEYARGLKDYAAVSMRRGKHVRALGLLREAQACYAALGDREGLALASSDEARCLIDLGRAHEALQVIAAALPRAAAMVDRYWYRLLRINQTVALSQVGRGDEAAVIFDEILPEIEQSGDGASHAYLLMTSAIVRAEMAADAEDVRSEVLRLSAAAVAGLGGHERTISGSTHYNYANNLAADGQLDEAERQYRAALAAAARTKDAHLRARVLLGLAAITERRGHEDEVLALFREALAATVAGSARDLDARWRILERRARYHWLTRNDTPAARDDIGQAVAIVEDLAVAPAYFLDRLGLRGQHADVYRLAALIDFQDSAAAFALAQRAKSHTLTDLVSGVVRRQTAVAPSGAVPRSPLARAVGRLGRALGRRASVAAAPVAAPIEGETRTGVVSLAELRACLRPGEAFLDCLSSVEIEGGVRLLFITPEDGIVCHPFVGGPELAPLIQALDTVIERIAARRSVSPTALAQAMIGLREALLDPLRRSPDGHDVLAPLATLFVSASGVLHRVPWSALLAPALGAEEAASGDLAQARGPAICMVPSATSLWMQRRDLPAAPEWPARLVALAPFDAATAARTTEPSDDEPITPLPESIAEIAAVARLIAPEHALTLAGEAASLEALLRHARRANLLLLATHGEHLAAGRPVLDFGLLFPPRAAAAQATKATVLTMRAIFAGELRLRPGCQVALTSCHLGEVLRRGEEAIGITQAFLSTGAATCLAALWPVGDRASKLFSLAYHRGLLGGLTPAEALRRAMAVVRDTPEWSHPFYWAGFLLVGDGARAPFPHNPWTLA